MSSYSGEPAEQVVRLYLEGVEVAAKLSGKAAERLAVLLYAVLKDQKKTKGKIRLSNMIRSGKELKVFAVRDADLEKFCVEAKKYGVLYCVLKDKDASDGLTDIMVRAEDAGKVNRIFERFNLTTVDMGALRGEVIRETEKNGEDIPQPERVHLEPIKDAEYMAELMGLNPNKEEQQTSNPTEGRIVKSRQSEPTSKRREDSKAGEDFERGEFKPSVREELKEIREELDKKAGKIPAEPELPNVHIAPPQKKIPVKER